MRSPAGSNPLKFSRSASPNSTAFRNRLARRTRRNRHLFTHVRSKGDPALLPLTLLGVQIVHRCHRHARPQEPSQPISAFDHSGFVPCLPAASVDEEGEWSGGEAGGKVDIHHVPSGGSVSDVGLGVGIVEVGPIVAAIEEIASHARNPPHNRKGACRKLSACGCARRTST